jgi:hypothetical protein
MSHATTTLPTPPERIHNWLDTQLSIARFAGGLTYKGHYYTIAYDEPGHPLVRSDIKAAEIKAASDSIRRAFAEGRRERAAAQKALFLPSDDTEGGSHD